MVSHSCDRGWHTPLLLNRDRTTGMSGEGNQGDVTGRILVHPQDPTQSYPAALAHPTTSTLAFHPFLNPTNIFKTPLHAWHPSSPVPGPFKCPMRVRSTKPVIGIPPRHSLRQCLRVLLARVLPRPSLLPPPRVSPETSTVYTRLIPTHNR